MNSRCPMRSRLYLACADAQAVTSSRERRCVIMTSSRTVGIKSQHLDALLHELQNVLDCGGVDVVDQWHCYLRRFPPASASTEPRDVLQSENRVQNSGVPPAPLLTPLITTLNLPAAQCRYLVGPIRPCASSSPFAKKTGCQKKPRTHVWPQHVCVHLTCAHHSLYQIYK